MRVRCRCILVLLALAGLHCAPRDPDGRVKSKGDLEETKIVVEPPAVPDKFRERLEAALEHVRKRDLLTTHGFWTIFHGILGMGPEATTLVNPDTDSRVNAIDWIGRGN